MKKTFSKYLNQTLTENEKPKEPNWMLINASIIKIEKAADNITEWLSDLPSSEEKKKIGSNLSTVISEVEKIKKENSKADFNNK